MATTGFPWQAESHVREPTYLDEKIAPTAAPEKKQPDALNVITNNTNVSTSHGGKRCSTSSHHHGRHRAGSLKAQNAQRTAIRPYAPPRAQGPRNGPVQLPVRTLPAWIQDAEEGDLEDIDTSYLDAPDVAFLAQHNHSPASPRRLGQGASHEYRSNPTSAGEWRPERTSRWISFGRASVYPRENFNNEKVDPEWLNKNFTDYSQPWLANHEDDDDDEEGTSRYRAFRKKRQTWYKRFQFTILRNPFIPLAFRLTVIIFAVTAIGLGVTIYRETDKISACLRQTPGRRTERCIRLVGNDRVNYYRDPSALMAIIVDVVSVVYTTYITYDEYFSKPLGLRPARAKIRLVLLDLFFIVFQAANLSLSFESLTVDEGACAVGDEPSTYRRFDKVCNRQQSLSGVLLVSLVAWLLTFSVSVLRLVERIA